MAGWFDVDKNGLKQLLENKPKGFILRELIQNAWDEPGVTECKVSIAPVPGKVLAAIRVEDDAPEGFHDLTHAFTLFARTRKRVDPERRGRFNLGEKQVLALCHSAKISTTTGTIVFDPDGERHRKNAKLPAGSVVEITIPMTREEIAEAIAYTKTFMPPDRIVTTVNGERLNARVPIDTIQNVQLGTEYEDDSGSWRRTRRRTSIRLLNVRDSERAMLYEMGLPVVELEGGEKFHIDVQQRVPLNSDRDNVPPSFLTEVRAHVLNSQAELLSEEQASALWAREASGSKLVTADAFADVMDRRFGEQRVAYCPSDSESNRTAASHGYSVLTGGSLSAEEWENAKRFKAIPSAGTVFATARPKFGGNKDNRVPEDQWPDDVSRTVKMMKVLGGLALSAAPLQIEVVKDTSNHFQAWYSVGGFLTLNLTYLRDAHDTRAMLDLLLHEIAHERCGDHKLDVYHAALSEFGARLAIASALYPEHVLNHGKR